MNRLKKKSTFLALVTLAGMYLIFFLGFKSQLNADTHKIHKKEYMAKQEHLDIRVIPVPHKTPFPN